MLNIQVYITGLDSTLGRLNQLLLEKLPAAFKRSLTRTGKGIHREATELLSGPGRGPSTVRRRVINQETGDITYRRRRMKAGKAESLGAKPGSYPVPVLTGHLRRSLYFLPPGKSKTNEDGVMVTAGENEVVVSNSAIYAGVIHEGRWTSKDFGPRKFLEDGLERFNQGDQISQIFTEEIQKEIAESNHP